MHITLTSLSKCYFCICSLDYIRFHWQQFIDGVFQYLLQFWLWSIERYQLKQMPNLVYWVHSGIYVAVLADLFYKIMKLYTIVFNHSSHWTICLRNSMSKSKAFYRNFWNLVPSLTWNVCPTCTCFIQLYTHRTMLLDSQLSSVCPVHAISPILFRNGKINKAAFCKFWFVCVGLFFFRRKSSKLYLFYKCK